MVILLVIIFFHTLVIMRAKTGLESRLPYVSILMLSMALVAGVTLLMITMKVPG